MNLSQQREIDITEEYGLRSSPDDERGKGWNSFMLGPIRIRLTHEGWHLKDALVARNNRVHTSLQEACEEAQHLHVSSLKKGGYGRRDWKIGSFCCTTWAFQRGWWLELCLRVKQERRVLVGSVKLPYETYSAKDLYLYGVKWAQDEYIAIGRGMCK